MMIVFAVGTSTSIDDRRGHEHGKSARDELRHHVLDLMLFSWLGNADRWAKILDKSAMRSMP
jgi:hypothetical protein